VAASEKTSPVPAFARSAAEVVARPVGARLVDSGEQAPQARVDFPLSDLERGPVTTLEQQSQLRRERVVM
jgi:hypothetical protein